MEANRHLIIKGDKWCRSSYKCFSSYFVEIIIVPPRNRSHAKEAKYYILDIFKSSEHDSWETNTIVLQPRTLKSWSRLLPLFPGMTAQLPGLSPHVAVCRAGMGTQVGLSRCTMWPYRVQQNFSTTGQLTSQLTYSQFLVLGRSCAPTLQTGH